MNEERLTKLAEHLETGKLGHKKFNFRFYNADERGKQHVDPSCGYLGCAIGECPIVWPDIWIFDDCGYPSISGEDYSASDFFEISLDEFGHLFVPEEQDVERFGGAHLGGGATKEQVAANIRDFIKRKKIGANDG